MELISREEARAKGLKRYFTGKPCKRGHIAERFVACPACVECDRITYLAYQRANREKIRAKAKARREANKEEFNAEARRKYAENTSGIADYHAAYRKKNRDRIRTANSEYYHNNKEQLLAYGRRYYYDNTGRCKEYANKRHALKKKIFACWDAELTSFVVAEAYSLCEERKTSTGFSWHIDHMLPIQNKTVCGLHVWNNLQCLPQKLNNWKRTRLEFINTGDWLRDSRIWSDL